MANDVTNNNSDAANHLKKKNHPDPFSICFVAKQPVISIQPFLVKARCQYNA